IARRMAAATAHVLPEASEIRDGRLLIGGCDAEALAREHGTPAYVFAEDDLRARAREFRAALAAHHDGPGQVVFASKACPLTAVMRLFAEEGLRPDDPPARRRDAAGGGGGPRLRGRGRGGAAPRASRRLPARGHLPARQR